MKTVAIASEKGRGQQTEVLRLQGAASRQLVDVANKNSNGGKT
jgi:hypothetical protein